MKGLNRSLEERLFIIGIGLVVFGALVSVLIITLRIAIAFLIGGMLAAINLIWLRRAVSSVFARNAANSKTRFIPGFFFRLLLIPLCLYGMLRFLFLSVPAAVAGFAAFYCSIFVEGILEAFAGRSQ